MVIGVLQGPNLNRLGTRDPAKYGVHTLEDVQDNLEDSAQELGVQLAHFQPNHEGFLIDWLQENQDDLDGLVLNPAGLTTHGKSLGFAVAESELPLAIVHIPQVFRHNGPGYLDLFAEQTRLYLAGLGWTGYSVALRYLVQSINIDRSLSTGR